MAMTYQARVIRAAGILEGEGSFFLKTGKIYPMATCQMTDFDVLEELKDLFGGLLYETPKQQAHHKQSWRWQIQGDDAERVMREVLPFLFDRRTETIESILSAWTDLKNTREVERKNREERYLKIGLEYLNGGVTMRDLARKHGVSHQTVSNYAKIMQSMGSFEEVDASPAAM